MNSVILLGRLTKEPEMKYTTDGLAVATFNMAIDRGKDKNGKDRGADFPRVTVFGRQAENCERYLDKGSRVCVQGHIQTGKYENKNGHTVYTTDVMADKVEFIDWRGQGQGQSTKARQNERQGAADTYQDVPEDFAAVDGEEIPF